MSDATAVGAVPDIEAALEGYASGDPDRQARAAAQLQEALGSLNPRGPHGSVSGYMPPRFTYCLIDALLRSPIDRGDQACLLLGLMTASRDEGTVLLTTLALLSYPDEAFSLLWKRFASASDPEALFKTPDVLYALCRTGRRFADAVAAMARRGEASRAAVALAGVEGLARSRLTAALVDLDSEDHLAEDRRTRRKWAPLLPGDVPGETVGTLSDAAAGWVSHDDASVRVSALRVLGLLKASAHAGALREAARHPDLGTRTAALVALGELGDGQSADLLRSALGSQEAAERRTALDVVARLRPGGALEWIAARVEDPDPQVRRAAVYALAEFHEARGRLEALMRGPDRLLARAAAEAIHRGTRPAAGELEATRRRRERAGHAGRPVARISVDAAMRFALDELRAYHHRDLTERLSKVCSDHASTRRYLVEEGLFERRGDMYEPTALGGAVWRVERHILDRTIRVVPR